MSGGMTPLVLDRVLTLATNNAARLAYAAGNDHRLITYTSWCDFYPTGVYIDGYDRLSQALNGVPAKGYALLPDYYIGKCLSRAGVSDALAGLRAARAEYWRGRIKWLQSLGLLKPQPKPKEVP